MLFGCMPKGNKKPVPRKPFYVIDKKFEGYKGTDCYYWVIDADGQEILFEDFCKNWQVADTIR